MSVYPFDSHTKNYYVRDAIVFAALIWISENSADARPLMQNCSFHLLYYTDVGCKSKVGCAYF